MPRTVAAAAGRFFPDYSDVTSVQPPARAGSADANGSQNNATSTVGGLRPGPSTIGVSVTPTTVSASSTPSARRSSRAPIVGTSDIGQDEHLRQRDRLGALVELADHPYDYAHVLS